MPNLFETYQQRIAATPLKNKAVKAFLKTLFACQTLSVIEKIGLLTTPINNTSYRNFGHALLSTQRGSLIHHYLTALHHWVTNKKTAMAVLTVLCQILAIEGTLGHLVASYFNNHVVKHYLQLLRHLVSQGLPARALLQLLTIRSALGLTLSHCLACHQTSDSLSRYCQLLKSLEPEASPSDLFEVLWSPTAEVYSFDRYIALYQPAAGLRHYWLVVDYLIERGLSKNLVLHSLQQDIQRDQSLIQCIAGHQHHRGLEHTVHFLDRCLRRGFHAAGIANLLTLSTADGSTFGQLLAQQGNPRLLLHYEQLLVDLQQMGVSSHLCYLLHRSYRENLCPLMLAHQEAGLRKQMAPLLALLELTFPPTDIVNACWPFKSQLHTYICSLANTAQKLKLILLCLNNEGIFALGILFHRYTSHNDYRRNQYYLQSLANERRQLDQPRNRPPVMRHDAGLKLFYAPKPHSAIVAATLKNMLEMHQEDPVTCYTEPHFFNT